MIEGLPPVRTLDVGCGTGFLTEHLRGEITGLDQSERMLAVGAARLPSATFVLGDALALPFADGFCDVVSPRWGSIAPFLLSSASSFSCSPWSS